MNDLVTALMIVTLTGITGLVLVWKSRENSIASNFGIIVMGSSALLACGLVAMSIIGLFISFFLAVFG